jgi:hypothetical protein
MAIPEALYRVMFGPVPHLAPERTGFEFRPRARIELGQELPESYQLWAMGAMDEVGLDNSWARHQLVSDPGPHPIGALSNGLQAAVNNKLSSITGNVGYLETVQPTDLVTQPAVLEDLRDIQGDVKDAAHMIFRDFPQYVEALARRLPDPMEGVILRRGFMTNFGPRARHNPEKSLDAYRNQLQRLHDGLDPLVHAEIRGELSGMMVDVDQFPTFIPTEETARLQTFDYDRTPAETLRMVLDPERPRRFPVGQGVAQQAALTATQGIVGAVRHIQQWRRRSDLPSGDRARQGALEAYREMVGSHAVDDPIPSLNTPEAMRNLNNRTLRDYDAHFFGQDPAERFGASVRPEETRLATLLINHVPPGGTVTDVGGGLGIAALGVKDMLPDARVNVIDLYDSSRLMELYPEIEQDPHLAQRLDYEVNHHAGDALEVLGQLSPADVMMSASLSPYVENPLRLLMEQYNGLVPRGLLMTTVTSHMHDATRSWAGSWNVTRETVADLRAQGVPIAVGQDYRTVLMQRLDERPLVMRGQLIASEAERIPLWFDRNVVHYQTFYEPHEDAAGGRWLGLEGARSVPQAPSPRGIFRPRPRLLANFRKPR